MKYLEGVPVYGDAASARSLSRFRSANWTTIMVKRPVSSTMLSSVTNAAALVITQLK
jgi:hypothetical protein